ncbi:MAG: class I SAM-dependent methyltransferase [Clostridia bacterium]|nr:class I SAM-dependent methyltransferase [Clostridia bacterium]
MGAYRQTFDAGKYDRKIRQTLPFYEEFYRQAAELAGTVFERAVDWLDVGCGTGQMGRVALDSIPVRRLVCCDTSEEMLGLARERLGDAAEFAACDARRLPYAEAFDVVTAVQVFHYLQPQERRAAVEGCRKALREGGLFISFENIAPCTDMGRDVCLERWKRYQMAQGKSPEESGKHIARYGKDYFPITAEAHLRLLRDCGFKAAELLWLSNMQLGVWAVK